MKLNRPALEWKLKGKGIESDLVDIDALHDSSLTITEDFDNIMKECMPVPMADSMGKDETMAMMEKSFELESLHIKKLEDKAIQEARQIKTDVCIDRTAEKYITMVGKGIVNSCMLISSGGLGKSYLVSSTLNAMKKDYSFYNGHITKASIYKFLYENKDNKIIVFDDVSQLLESTGVIEMLKAVLWDNNGKARTISYKTTSKVMCMVPDSFEFTSRIIFIFNNIRRNKNTEALVTRLLYREINLSRTDRIKIMYQIAHKPYKNISKADRLMLTDYIKENTTSVNNLNFRMQKHIFDLYRSDKTNWKDFAKDIINSQDSKVRQLLINFMGKDKVKRKDVVKFLVQSKGWSIRSTQRKIKDWLEVGEIYADDERSSVLSLVPLVTE